MTKQAYTSWHQVVTLRDDLRSGELTLSIFAADLYDVVVRRARPAYQDPTQFFALTYPTFNLRELVKDVLLRLAGKNEKAVRQLELTYGGGKTHALITLYHLVSEPDRLPDLPAVHEFTQHAGGMTPPKACVAVLPFDKLDVEKGMETPGPNGERRWLRQPWSVLAFQIAGADGLRLLHAESKDEEREAPPAENLLRDLLEIPTKHGLATLVLIDEVLMYAREKVGLDPQWRHRLQDFFQALTQAATKVDRACIVASLLATDPGKSDELGKEITQELYAVLRREKEEGVQPVEKQDVAEVLRRRFFTPDSIRDRERFRPHVVAALEGIQALDEQTRKDRQSEEERYLASYPFHPELTEAFYTKWTQLEGFQRTRGVLRTFAMALRDAEKWDASPLVGTNVLLNAPGQTGLSEAARELASIAATEEYEGKRQEWSAILEGELAKARDIQEDFPALKGREVEQAVMATFLHSQPIGQRALTRDLLVLLGAAKADKIELVKALLRWTEVSYFLDEAAIAESTAGNGGTLAQELPKWWRLGTKPNLRQMHSDACARVPTEVIEMTIRDLIAKERRLTAGASAAGTRVHNLPERPRDIEDDGEFHYVVLGPRAASESGKPSSEARRFIDETTGPDRPRVYRNAILLVVPSRDGLELVRSRARDYLGWEEVRNLREAKDFDELRKTLLAAYTDEARKKIPDAIVQAYCIVVTVSREGEVEAFRITPSGEPVFETIKNDKRSRIQESAISPEALLPDGPYSLWREGETSRRASDLTRAFAQFPHLPKMLRQKNIVDTLALGCEQGYFVLRLVRPDKSIRTIWRSQPTENDLRERDLEVALPEGSELTQLDGKLLAPGALPGLWPEAAESIAVGDVLAFFDGSHTCKVMREGYEEVFPVPRAAKEVVEKAIQEAVRAGSVWLTAGPASIYREEIPYGVLTETAVLHPPPAELPATSVLPQNLEAAWREAVTTAASIADALSA
ncbi:MAG: DUF499 domain-containing protein, partial [Armatimonadota bacterium]|nr:DUF499 domain-containing protein [Armatimonadota bacterium]